MQREIVALYLGSYISNMYRSVLPQRLTEDAMHINLNAVYLDLLQA